MKNASKSDLKGPKPLDISETLSVPNQISKTTSKFRNNLDNLITWLIYLVVFRTR